LSRLRGDRNYDRMLISFLALGVHTVSVGAVSASQFHKGRQAAKAKRELAETESLAVDLGAGVKGSLRKSMCQAAIRILRVTAALAELWLPERPLTSR
jgi:hypothetical protein